MKGLQERIGYFFRDLGLLKLALAHPSAGGESNQRLEFLGDAVLQLLVSEDLYVRFPGDPEGKLSQRRASVVSGMNLARVAGELGLGEDLVMSWGEDRNGGRERESNLADALEAVLGAAYLDGGMEVARRCVRSWLGAALEAGGEGLGEFNPKGQLQEILQGIHPIAPEYAVVGESGPDHERSYKAVVHWQGQLLGRGEGASKKAAQIEAARVALERREWERGR